MDSSSYYNNTYSSSSYYYQHHHEIHPYTLVNQERMDGFDDDDNYVWDIVDSWFNNSPQLYHDVDYHNNLVSSHGDRNYEHETNRNYEEVGGGSGSVGIDNSGDEGKSRSDDHGIQNDDEFDTEDHQCPEDEEDHQLLALQVVWPSAPVPDSCSSCQVLREIIHTNGTHTTKLEIHGKIGVISHATYGSNDGLASNDDFQKHHMLDFSKQHLVDIKDYLQDYLDERQENGYSLLHEPLSLFYEALCVGYDWLNFLGYNPGVGRGESSNQATVPLVKVPHWARPHVPTAKSELAIQRERVKNMKLEDLAKYFDMRITDASEVLRLCATVLKKKLRSYNISRWPYRKVQSLKRKILDLEAKRTIINNRAVEAEIKKLQKKLTDILSGKLKP